ncbi:TylF/MycF/NovP-related O-methyltransferase [Undibacterium pigrum]|uniref:Macrocin-O-methyltransferase TylF n=1 Tax=Undibacterium pigrum TaxID=401470 RepID=A0A318JE19_9BURK|nr:TylF/MycF/NovP-related O-methyltransferase [Undibacterium pigrum]PXX46766.1 macrocin-O-methyltransferase TylF [Undibacterium pigrum]
MNNNYFALGFYALENGQKFIDGLQQSIEQLTIREGIFAADNLFTYNRNLSFLSDEKFMGAFNKSATGATEQSIIWRNYILCWAARNALRLDGDFVEAACYKGTTAKIIWDYVNSVTPTSKHYYLYDLFQHDDQMSHHAMPDHGNTLFEEVKAKFADSPNVHVIQGKVPDSFAIAVPEKISLIHLDMNNAEAEIGALEVLFDRLVPGGILILDDYGWLYYRDQKSAEDDWLGKRGYQVLELPTGQGMVIKVA